MSETLILSTRPSKNTTFAANVLVGSAADVAPHGSRLARRVDGITTWEWSVAIVDGIEVVQVLVATDDASAMLSAAAADYPDVLKDFFEILDIDDLPEPHWRSRLKTGSAQVIVGWPTEIKGFYVEHSPLHARIVQLDGSNALEAPRAGLPGLLAKMARPPVQRRPANLTVADSLASVVARRSQNDAASCLAVTWGDGDSHAGGIIASWTDSYELFSLSGPQASWHDGLLCDAIAEPAMADPGLFWLSEMSPGVGASMVQEPT